jgi:hypothetical protein
LEVVEVLADKIGKFAAVVVVVVAAAAAAVATAVVVDDYTKVYVVVGAVVEAEGT